MSIELELQIASQVQTLPHPSQFREWVSATLWGRVDTGEMVIRIVDEEEGKELNEQYRHKEGATNVLSFPYEPTPGIASRYLGDIVICAPVVQEEADKYNKSILGHWAHMVVHGTLHLIGYDHELEDEALEMKRVETKILVTLGFLPPYGEMTIND